ncbi:MAG: DUF3784 domain-containing protein [Ruminococcus sp.]|nr:DUF3784 domain-containing protein [Ruminococcus sp.]
MKVEMISWIAVAMGIFLLVVGIVIWVGKKIDMVHGEEASKVADYDVEPYARLLGIGVIILSLAVISYGVLSCFPMIPVYFQWIAVGVFGGAGTAVLLYGHKKYFSDK